MLNSFKRFPTLSSNEIGYCRLSHAVAPGQSRLAHSRCASLPNISHILIGQLCPWMRRSSTSSPPSPARQAPLGRCILHVLFRSAEKKMIRIDAKPNIASVTHINSTRNVTSGKEPCDPMCPHCSASPFYATVSESRTFPQGSLPYPTSRFIRFGKRPKSFGCHLPREAKAPHRAKRDLISGTLLLDEGRTAMNTFIGEWHAHIISDKREDVKYRRIV